MSRERELLELIAKFVNEAFDLSKPLRMPGNSTPSIEDVQRFGAMLDKLKSEFAALGIEVKWPL
jgi:hypothetical protein